MELASLEADRLPDQKCLLRRRQVDQAETPLVITILRDLAEGQLVLQIVSRAECRYRSRTTSHRSIPMCNCDLVCPCPAMRCTRRDAN